MYQRQMIGGSQAQIRTRTITSLRRWRGVTLTEVAVASGLLLVAIVPLLKALTIAQTTDRVIERKTRSLLLAQRELERIRAQSLYHYEDLAVASQPLDAGFLCDVADDGNANLKQVTVSVGFDLNGDHLLSAGEIDVRLCTYLARRWPGP